MVPRVCIALALFATLICPPALAEARFVAQPPAVSAMAALLMDARTGHVLYSLAADIRRPPASTTKMLTALLVAEALSPDTRVQISRRASVERSGAAIGMEVGERWTAGELMRAMLMHSANDAAVALAEAVAGSVEEFAERMNARARALGARNSNFVTPHGRHSPQHYSTARDLALIGRESLRMPWIAKIVGSQTWKLHGKLYRGRRRTRLVINTNSLLWRYPGADGIKTGWILESGPCLVASATRGGWQLIAVVMNTRTQGQSFRDAAALLEYGFGAFTRVRAASRGESVGTVPIRNSRWPLVVAAAEDAIVVAPRNSPVSRNIQLTKSRAPIARGEVVGALVLTSGGVEVGRVPVVAAEAIPSRWLLGRVWQWLRNLVNSGE
jgi:D-alanyl-D-alanine carboxypeptidase (penicillin-binding protein 5/6)